MAPENRPTPPAPERAKSIQSQIVEEPVKKYAWLIVAGIAVLAVAAVLIIRAAKKHTPATQTNNNEQNPLTEIRQAFPATSSTSTNVSISTSTPTETPAAPAPAAPASTTPANFTFRDPAHGFSLELNASWQRDQGRDTENSVAFINNELKQQGYVEIYNNTSGETLDSIAASLRGSPSIVSVSDTQLAGEPAVFFRGQAPAQNGIAALHAGKIFYIRGDLASTPVAEGFAFLQ